MQIQLVTPAPPHSYHGNRVTASRWAAILHELGHIVDVTESYQEARTDLLIALHARKSADAVLRARTRQPRIPVILALTGTDLYPDLRSAGVDLAVLEAADRLLVLQPLALEQLPRHLRDRTRVVLQSAASPPEAPAPAADVFPVTMLAHLRPVKDPLLVADAVRLLPGDSRVLVDHAGAVIDPGLGSRASTESRTNPRYRWLGELPRPHALRLVASSRILLHPSRHEGGANVVSEALAAGIPVLASQIPGTQGILGSDYPGYFPAGDAAALAELLLRAERNIDGCYDELLRACDRLRSLVMPERERAVWARLLAELAAGGELPG
jgi:putative glycosyltransferase (TIGR04348 family)